VGALNATTRTGGPARPIAELTKKRIAMKLGEQKFVLENETLQLEFLRETGALVGLTAKPDAWALLDRPQLSVATQNRSASEWRVASPKNRQPNTGSKRHDY